MKVLVLGYSMAGKSTAAEIAASMLGCSNPVNTSDILIHDFCVSNNLPMDKVVNNKNLYRDALFKFGVQKQIIDPRYPVPEALEKSDVVTGVRTPESLESVRHMFNLIIWISRPSINRGPTDKLSSYDCDTTIINNGTMEELKVKLSNVLSKYAHT